MNMDPVVIGSALTVIISVLVLVVLGIRIGRKINKPHDSDKSQ